MTEANSWPSAPMQLSIPRTSYTAISPYYNDTVICANEQISALQVYKVPIL